jgi:protein-tyrosine phosphatase
MALNVLFVCTGNSCRSPMAEGILRSVVPLEFAGDVVTGSAGTAMLDGLLPAPNAVSVMSEHGIDITPHRGRGLHPEIVDGADLILAMTAIHVGEIRDAAPGAREKTHLLSEFAGGVSKDVPDPIGGPREEYEKVYDMLSEMITEALPRIIALAKEKRP